jgi:hypothetical protein
MVEQMHTTSSRKKSFLSKPEGREPVDIGTLSYFRQRNKGLMYDVVINEFEKSGISQTDLAARLKRGTDQVSRWLGSPGNWTLDSTSDLLFAISGAAPTYGVDYPLNMPIRNQQEPAWFTGTASGSSVPLTGGEVIVTAGTGGSGGTTGVALVTPISAFGGTRVTATFRVAKSG